MPQIRIEEHVAAVAPEAWNALLEQSPQPTPFMRHEYLAALIDSGSATADTGWAPLVLLLEDDAGALQAACIAWIKSHSYGEYVFDWSWADAYQRHGLEYYPKLLVAVPFTPVPGSRLLARDAASRRVLLQALRQLAQQQSFSSVHLLFGDEADHGAADEEHWMPRSGVQFHWLQGGHADFAAYLASMQRDKRKKIQQEQRRVREAGITFEALQGGQITPEDWDFFHRCYRLTYRAHHSSPYLTRDFFDRMATNMPANWLMFLARRGEERVACSLIALDPERRAAFGRYWGCIEPIPNLHFDACYYQPLAWCIEQGYERFEGGAQGEHKMARGLMPVATRSSHWLAHPDFARAIGDFLEREGQAMDHYRDELTEHAPFKK
ncbi:GNAT family N-acetyltransferase [Burkholderiaceae bacterium UC74_6]